MVHARTELCSTCRISTLWTPSVDRGLSVTGQRRDRSGTSLVSGQSQRVLWTRTCPCSTAACCRELRELLAPLVASEAGCQYCAGTHALVAQLTDASPHIVAATHARSVAGMPVDDKLQGADAVHLTDRSRRLPHHR